MQQIGANQAFFAATTNICLQIELRLRKLEFFEKFM